MEVNLQNSLSGIILVVPFGIGAIAFFVFGIKRLGRFFIADYQENPKDKFRDNLIGNIFLALGVACILPAVFALQKGEFNWGVLLLSLCLSLFILPISILGSYWRSYMTNKLWGGFMPIVREQYGYPQTVAQKQINIDSSKIKISRKALIIAFSMATLFFFGCNLLLLLTGWNESGFISFVFRLAIPGIMSLGIFMTIVSASLSRRIQKLRSGEPLDEDDGS